MNKHLTMAGFILTLIACPGPGWAFSQADAKKTPETTGTTPAETRGEPAAKASPKAGKDRNSRKKLNPEEDLTKRYKKWLEEDVPYIITEDEKDIFRKLTTDDERDQFIEQFWQRRNPDPKSSHNAYKEEYYRRIAYANEHFAAGIPGWKTDRGMVYIKFGPPTHIEDYTYGSSYERPSWEGGGKTKLYPTQIWEYRYIPGLGQDIELEFVDLTSGNLYTLTVDANRKDLLLLSDPMSGATENEMMGFTDRFARVTGRRERGAGKDPHHKLREKDMPFNKYMTLAKVYQAPELQYNDLKSIVGTQVSYDDLPFRARTDYIKISEHQVLVPITVQVHNSELKFKDEQFSYKRAKVNLYGIVTTLSGRFVQEFEDDVVKECKENDYPEEKKTSSRYQKFLLLPPGTYKLGLVVKDTHSGKIGNTEIKVEIPGFDREGLSTSSLILSRDVQKVSDPANDLGQFVLGDLKVVPDFDCRYTRSETMWIYMQLYNMGIDQQALEPRVDVEYVFEKDGAVFLRYQDLQGSTFKFIAGDRIVIAGKLPLKRLESGKYTVRIIVRDQISGTSIERLGRFEVES